MSSTKNKVRYKNVEFELPLYTYTELSKVAKAANVTVSQAASVLLALEVLPLLHKTRIK